ncbi:MAG: hypothetical protein M3342_17990 [Bacteroidota bacterium]|nr:hypothetical protein [Bacteroidota bacterium]
MKINKILLGVLVGAAVAGVIFFAPAGGPCRPAVVVSFDQRPKHGLLSNQG